jgi:hypothetical protein
VGWDDGEEALREGWDDGEEALREGWDDGMTLHDVIPAWR